MLGREREESRVFQAEGMAGAKAGGRKIPLCLGEGRQAGVVGRAVVGGEKGEVGWRVCLSHTGAYGVRDRSEGLMGWCTHLFLPPNMPGTCHPV